MKKSLILAIPAAVLALSGCTGGSTGAATAPTELTPERLAEIEAHEKAVEEEERAHQSGG